MVKDLNIVVKAKNVEEFFGILSLTKYYQSKGEAIPSVLIIRLFEIMADVEVLKKNEINERANKYSIIAYNKVKSVLTYEIHWKERKTPITDIILKPDTRIIFSELIYAFLLFKENNPQAGKDESIAFYYWALMDYYKSEIMGESLIHLKPSHYAIIAGILTIATGFQLATKPNNKLTKENIFQSTRHAISKDYETKRKKSQRKKVLSLKKSS